MRNEVLAHHPALAEARSDVRRANAALDAERALRSPQPFLAAEYEQMPDNQFLRAGLVITLPIVNRRQGPIAEAEARITQAKTTVTLRQLEISANLEQAYRLYEIAGEQVASFQQGALREAEAALSAAEAAYRLGERGIIEVLDAQRVLRGIRLDYLNAQYDREAALIELERLRGQDF